MVLSLDDKTTGFLEVLGSSLLGWVAFLLIFLPVRRKWPHLYDYRRYAEHLKSRDPDDAGNAPPQAVSNSVGQGWFSWLGAALYTPEGEIVDRVGVDAAVFLHFFKSQVQCFSIICILTLTILCPIFVAGPRDDLPDDNPAHTRGMSVLSLANLRPGDPRLWAVTFFEFFIPLVVLYFLRETYGTLATWRRQHRLKKNLNNFSLIVADIPPTWASPAGVKRRFESVLPGTVAEVVMVKAATIRALLASTQLPRIIRARERAEAIERETGESERVHPQGHFWRPRVDAARYYAEEEGRLRSLVRDEGEVAEDAFAAIVTFRSRLACSLMSRAVLGGKQTEWRISRAPEPAGVHWWALRIPVWQTTVREILVKSFVALTTFFWIIPVSFITGLANLSALSKIHGFEWAARIRDWSPEIVGLIEGVLPSALLAGFIALMPLVFRFAALQQRLPALHCVEAKTRNYLYFFTLWGSFLFVVIGGTAIGRLRAIIDHPSIITDLLAAGVPKNDTFFASFIVIRTFVPAGLLLLDPIRLLLRKVYIWMARTEREKREAEKTFVMFPFYSHYGTAMMVQLIGVGYSTLSPIVSVCALVFFMASYPVYKFVLLYVNYREWTAGGRDFPGCFWGCVVSLLVKQLTMIGVLTLYDAPIQAGVILIPFGLTLLAAMSIESTYRDVVEHGCVADLGGGVTDAELPDEFKGLYRQPGVHQPRYSNLSTPVDSPIANDASYASEDGSSTHHLGETSQGDAEQRKEAKEHHSPPVMQSTPPTSSSSHPPPYKPSTAVPAIFRSQKSASSFSSLPSAAIDETVLQPLETPQDLTASLACAAGNKHPDESSSLNGSVTKAIDHALRRVLLSGGKRPSWVETPHLDHNHLPHDL